MGYPTAALLLGFIHSPRLLVSFLVLVLTYIFSLVIHPFSLTGLFCQVGKPWDAAKEVGVQKVVVFTEFSLYPVSLDAGKTWFSL